MEKIWRLSKYVVFKEVEKNLFIITFTTEAEKQRVLAGKHWLFDNFLFALQPLDGRKKIKKINFDFEYVWVHLHDLLVHYMKRSYGELIGNSIGIVLDLDVDIDDTGWGSFLHVRVELNLTKPLA